MCSEHCGKRAFDDAEINWLTSMGHTESSVSADSAVSVATMIRLQSELGPR